MHHDLCSAALVVHQPQLALCPVSSASCYEE